MSYPVNLSAASACQPDCTPGWLQPPVPIHPAPSLPQVDARDYGVAAHILRDLGVGSITLLTNNPAKHNCMRAHGIAVAECLPLLPPPQGGNGTQGGSQLGSSNGSQHHLV